MRHMFKHEASNFRSKVPGGFSKEALGFTRRSPEISSSRSLWSQWQESNVAHATFVARRWRLSPKWTEPRLLCFWCMNFLLFFILSVSWKNLWTLKYFFILWIATPRGTPKNVAMNGVANVERRIRSRTWRARGYRRWHSYQPDTGQGESRFREFW